MHYTVAVSLCLCLSCAAPGRLQNGPTLSVYRVAEQAHIGMTLSEVEAVRPLVFAQGVFYVYEFEYLTPVGRKPFYYSSNLLGYDVVHAAPCWVRCRGQLKDGTFSAWSGPIYVE